MIIGHQKQWQFLKKISDSGNIPHAFLFSGPEKLGKKKVAKEWISFMFKDSLEKVHPDLMLLEPGGKEIQIGQIKELIKGLSLKPYQSFLKAAIIDDAHLMNSEAQSCLLKTLEEPKGDTLLILISSQPSFLLPTIISRTQQIHFYPVSEKEMKEFVSDEYLKASMGCPGLALDFSNENKRDNFKKKMLEIADISKKNLSKRFEYAKTLAEEENLKETLKIWISYFRNILLLKLEKGESLKKTKNILNSLQKADYLLSRTNVNTRLLLETLMIEI